MNVKPLIIVCLVIFFFFLTRNVYPFESETCFTSPSNQDSLKIKAEKKFIRIGAGIGTNISCLIKNEIQDLHSHMFDSSFIYDFLPLNDSALLLSTESLPHLGFVVGLSVTLRLTKLLDLSFSPSFSFNDRYIIYDIQYYKNHETIPFHTIKKIPSTYLNFPIELKLKLNQYSNFQPYIVLGVQYSFDLYANDIQNKNNVRQKSSLLLKPNSLFMNFGFGLRIYTKGFRLTLEMKNMLSVNDNLNKEKNIYTDGFQSIRSNIVQLFFIFD